MLFVAAGLFVAISRRFPDKLMAFEPFAVVLVLAVGVANFLLAAALQMRSKSVPHVTLTILSVAQILLLINGMHLVARRTEFFETAPGGMASVLARWGVPAASLRTLGLKRDTQYALNFYLHREIRDWRGDPIEDGYVLSNGLYCDQIDHRFNCEDLWGRIDFASGPWALLRITPRASAPARSGQPR